MYGHDGPATLIPGAPFIRIADLVYGGREAGGYSSDVHHPGNVAFAVHLFARLVALTPDDPRYAALHSVGHGSSIARDLPIGRLDEIIGADPSARQPASSGF